MEAGAPPSDVTAEPAHFRDTRGPDGMRDRALLERIERNPDVMTGKAVIRGTRLTVEHILNLLDHGETVEEIASEYRGVSREDVLACALFAKKAQGTTASARGSAAPTRRGS